jgi:hypothetical protein
MPNESAAPLATALRHLDPDAHEPGCLDDGSGQPCADPAGSYVDVFCKCHHFTEPKVLVNGSDIAWPAGWTQKEAEAWREANSLVRPAD